MITTYIPKVRLLLAFAIMWACRHATAAQAPVALGSAANFAVLASSTVTSGGLTTVYGDLGAEPGTAIPGFPPGTVSGTIYAGGPVPAQAEADLTTAYNDAAGRTLATTVAGNIGGQTLTPGLYHSTSSLAISSGDLTLDAQGDTNGVFIFQMASTLTTTAGRQVILTGGATAINVFWQVGSSATLGTSSVFEGTIMAQASISIENGAKLHGRALARTGAVTLDTDIITLAPLPEPPVFGLISRATNGPATFDITNTPGAALTIQTSTNLIDWTDLNTLTPEASPYSYTDLTASGKAIRFYRALYR